MLISLQGVTVGEPGRDLVLTEYELDLGNLRTGDVVWPIGHGSRPGADFLEAAVLTLTLRTAYGIRDRDAADQATSAFLRAWRSILDAPPGQMVPLLIQYGGRSRVLHGRPGRISPPTADSVLHRQGFAEIIAQFRVLDPFVYAESSESLSLSVVPRSLGGIVAPIVTPVTTTMTSGVEYRMLTVGGDAPAPLRVTFHGPARDPLLTAAGVEVGLVGSLAYDEDVVVDARDRTVLLADGTPTDAQLTRGTRLDRLRLPPGTHELSFTATDRTGTARVTVEATPAFYHL